jgi:hypothetical protein
MPDEINPIQFVEGINEGALPTQMRFIRVQEYPWFAIQYSSNYRFSLSKIDIGLLWGKYTEPVEYGVKLLSDYKDNPTDIILSEGKLVFDVAESGFGWRRVELNHPAVVMSGKKYWISLESKQALYSLLRPEEGAGVAMRVYVNDLWLSGSSSVYKLMLRLYGRILHNT